MKYFFFFLFISSLYSCKKNFSETITKNYTINGKILKNLNKKKVFLKIQEKGNTIIIDSTILKNGEFEFKGKLEKPEVFGIFIDSIKGAIGLFMENSTITIQVNKDSLSSSNISGSSTHDEYLNFLKKSKKITSKITIIFPEFQKARSENNAEELKAINKRMQAINNENTQFTLGYAKQNPDSYVSAYALYSVLKISSIEKDSISKIYTNFSDYVKKGDYSKQIEQFLNTDIDSLKH